MNDDLLLSIDGDVARPAALRFDDLCAVDAAHQVPDVSVIDPQRSGGGVTLAGLLERVEPRPAVRYITLHASADDFHASVPLEAVLDRGVLLYRQGDGPLPNAAGGPLRFLIRDFAACHSAEVDECANVKFVDHIELTRDKGYDNRPEDDAEHEALHRKEVDE